MGLLLTQQSAFRTRLTTENDLGWYDASYRVPAELTLTADEPLQLSLSATNQGEIVWRASGERAFALGYRWLDAAGQEIEQVLPGAVPLPHDVAPGETIELDATLHSPLPPGSYRLSWGMLQHQVLWFRHRGVTEPESAVRIVRGQGSPPQEAAPPLETRAPEAVSLLPPTVPRRALWQAALRMWQARPLLGHGPDSFRNRYGLYLGMEAWDTRLYANNLYLEFLATQGILGTLAAGWLLLTVLLPVARHGLMGAGGARQGWGLALTAALLAFLIHGMLDYFLASVSVATLFWLLLGMAAALAEGWVEQRPVSLAQRGDPVEQPVARPDARARGAAHGG